MRHKVSGWGWAVRGRTLWNCPDWYPRSAEAEDGQSQRSSLNFDADPSLDEIIAQQGKGPITDLSVLHGNFWPEEESIEDFLAALQ